MISEEKVLSVMDRRGFSKYLTRLSMDDYTVPEEDGGTKARRVVEKYIDKADEMLDNGVGIFFAGPTGVGKSMLATIIVKEVIKTATRRPSPLLVNCDQLIQSTNDMWFREKEAGVIPLKKICETDLLVIDDIPNTLNNSRDVYKIIEEVLARRNPNNLPTIITYGKGKQDFKREAPERLLSFVTEKLLVVDLQNIPDRRAAKGRKIIEMFDMQDMLKKKGD